MQKHTSFTNIQLDSVMNFSIRILALVFALFLLLPAQAQETSSSVQLEQQVFEIARKVRCPVCRSESAADSNATTSIEFRNIIQEKLEEGLTEAEIIAFFQESYGDWILLDPPKRGLHLVVWLAPLIAGVLGLILLTVLLRGWTRKANETPVALSEEELQKVRTALENTTLESTKASGETH